MRALGHSFGLTGGVASGKSTVARFFTELGAKVIDADRLGHELIRAPLPAYQEVVGRLGREILDPAGEIDRKRLGAIVFASPQMLLELNAILHPRIIERVGELADQYHTQDPTAVVLVDAALIYEAGMEGRFKKMLVAWCRADQQVERLMAKAAVSREEAERRIAAQMPSEEKRRRADYVIDCSGTKENTHTQVQALYPELECLVERNQV
jgi:dephospho-CoA kinase